MRPRRQQPRNAQRSCKLGEPPHTGRHPCRTTTANPLGWGRRQQQWPPAAPPRLCCRHRTSAAVVDRCPQDRGHRPRSGPSRSSVPPAASLRGMVVSTAADHPAPALPPIGASHQHSSPRRGGWSLVRRRRAAPWTAVLAGVCTPPGQQPCCCNAILDDRCNRRSTSPATTPGGRRWSHASSGTCPCCCCGRRDWSPRVLNTTPPVSPLAAATARQRPP